MPQNQRLASGLASAKAEMSSSSPGRIAVPSATMSRPAGSRMKPEEARPTHVACVTRRVDGVEVQRFIDAWVVFRAAQLAICSTSSPPPRTASPLAAPLGVARAAAPEMRARARRCIFVMVMVCSVRFFRERRFLLVCYLI